MGDILLSTAPLVTFVALLFTVERRGLVEFKASLFCCALKGRPDSPVGVVENDGGPTAWLEYSRDLAHRPRHQGLIPFQIFTTSRLCKRLVDDCLVGGICDSA